MGKGRSSRGSQRNATDITKLGLLNEPRERFTVSTSDALHDLETDNRSWRPESMFAPIPLSPFKAKRAIQYRLNVPARVADNIISKLTVPAFVQNNSIVRKIVCARRQVRRAVFFAKNLQNKAGFGNKSRRYAWHSKIKCK